MPAVDHELDPDNDVVIAPLILRHQSEIVAELALPLEADLNDVIAVTAVTQVDHPADDEPPAEIVSGKLEDETDIEKNGELTCPMFMTESLILKLSHQLIAVA